MKAIVVSEYGGSETLRYVDASVPEPEEGEVRVKLAYAGVNFIDVYDRQGIYKKSHTYKDKPPFVLGREGVGIVDKVGPGVDQLSPGDRVGWCLIPGSYAQFAVVPAWKLVRIPTAMDWQTAATLMLQGGTAHYLSHSLFPLKPGHTALIHAGAGGVGRLLVQLAKSRGARVLTTVGNEEKAALARELGADLTILYRHEDFSEAVLKATDGAGVDVVYDGIGQATFQGDLKVLRRHGALVLFGAASGVVNSVDPLELAEAGSVWLTRPHMAHYMATGAEVQGRFADLAQLVEEQRLDVNVDQVFPLEDAAEAHRYLEAGRTTGKLLLRIPA